MRVYLAADYSRKYEMRGCRTIIEGLGHDVTSQWIDHEDSIEAAGIGGVTINDSNTELYGKFAAVDCSDLACSDMMILFTTGEKSRGGRHTEFGMALEQQKIIVIVGPRENVFQCDPNIVQYPTWRAFVIDFARGWNG